MLSLQRFAVLLYLLQFGSAMMIPNSPVVSRPSTFSSPVVPAVRSTLNRRPIAPRAGIVENVADFAVKLTLITQTVKCAHELAKKCVDAYYSETVSPTPLISSRWTAPAIEFPINFLDSEDWEFVGFHGTVTRHIDMSRSTIISNSSDSAMQKLGRGFYATDSIMVGIVSLFVCCLFDFLLLIKSSRYFSARLPASGPKIDAPNV
ncbi:hypothetical protein BKA69DRAFT_847179 [Paraphysoderma sedebokerense]|nr:hypothetical protein BKA69DRAFT_847179 [Paraphysoderma sedebokerense]